VQSRFDAATYTDNSSSGTVSTVTTTNSFGVPTFAASSATTYTNAATVYIAGAPTTGTNATITNSHALYVAAGRTTLVGPLTASTSVTTPVMLNTAAQSTVSGSTSGSAIFAMPQQGVGKTVYCHSTALNGTATYTFPAAFTYTPVVTVTSAGLTVTSISTTGVTVTGTGTSGLVKLEELQ